MNENLRTLACVEFSTKIRNVNSSQEKLQNSTLGTFPVHWQIVTLGDVLSKIIDRRGITPLKLGGNWSDDGIIALSAKCVKNHELINLDTANRVDQVLYKKWMPEKLRVHDILMTSEAPLGEFYYIAADCEFCLSQRLFALRANTDIIEPSVLYFQLTDTIGLHEIDIRKTGTTVFGIRQSELVKIPIVLPPMTIQKKFAKLCNPLLLEIEKNAKQCRSLAKLQNLLFSGSLSENIEGA
jgi:type I restriction enzyme S subunit